MRTDKGEFIYEHDAWAEALRRSLPENAEGASSCAEGSDLARGSVAEGSDLARGSVAANSAGVGGHDPTSASLAHRGSVAEGSDLARGPVAANSAGVGGHDPTSAESLAHVRKKRGRQNEMISDTDFLARVDLKACMSSLDAATTNYCRRQPRCRPLVADAGRDREGKCRMSVYMSRV